MPFLVIYAEEESSNEQKQALCEFLTPRIAKNFKIHDQAVRIIFQEPSENQVSYSGWLKSDNEFKEKKTAIQNANPYAELRTPLIILYTEMGKTQEQFEVAAKDITQAISEHLNVPAFAVRIIFQDIPENRIASGGFIRSSPEYKAEMKAAL